MKTVPYNIRTLLVGLLFHLLLIAQAQEAERSINRSFPLNEIGKIVINNSYGAVKLNSWDKNEVNIQVNIVVDAGSEKRSSEILADIAIDLTAEPSLVKAITRLPNQNNSWWKSWGIFTSGKVDYTIDYLVQFPKTAAVEIDNHYGAIYLDEIDGKADISCAYGKIDLGELNHTDNQIQIQYTSKSHIGFILGGTIEADYSSLQIDQAQTLSYDADYTKSYINNVSSFDFNADYGNLTIENAQVVRGNADYLTISIGTIRQALELNMDYGGLDVDLIQDSTEYVSLDADYVGIKLGVDPDWTFAFSIDADYASFKTDFDLDYTEKITKNTSRIYRGIHKKGNHQLKISTDYGGIKLYQN